MATIATPLSSQDMESKLSCQPATDGTPVKETKHDFDPLRHLTFKRPSKVYTMKDLGLPEHTGISPVAVSEPFPLFTQEAVRRMREEVLHPDVLENCQYSGHLAQCQLRGFATKLVF